MEEANHILGTADACAIIDAFTFCVYDAGRAEPNMLTISTLATN